MGTVETLKVVIPEAPSIGEDAVREALRRVLAWESFRRSERLSRFLRYTVEQVLDSPSPQLKEYVIAVEVFDKPKTFDPRLDPIVRVEARRLRTRIREYYETEGRSDSVQIRFGTRGYRPVFESAPRRSPPQPATPIKSKPAIAVLPFIDLSPESAHDRLSASFTEELINVMGRSHAFRVASRTSTQRYEGKSFDIRAAGRELGVDAILEGSVRREGGRIRFAAQLCSVSDGLELWSRSYDHLDRDTFHLLSDLAANIAESIAIRLGAGRAPAPRAIAPANVNAYRHYLKGLHSFRCDDVSSAASSLRRAIEEEPDFAPAHAGLGLVNTFLVWVKEVRPVDAWPGAELAAAAALKLDPEQAVAQSVLACKRALFDWDWRAAERMFQTAIEMNRREPVAREWYACACLGPRLRLDEALREVEIAQTLDPLSPLVQCHAGLIHFYRRDATRARAFFGSAIDLDPGFWPALCNLGRVQLWLDDFASAQDTLEEAKKIAGSAAVVDGYLGYCYARRGQTGRAVEIVEALRSAGQLRYISPLQLARVFLGLQRTAEAVTQIEIAREHRCARLVEILADPLYAPLYREERFQQLVRHIGLPSQ